MFADPQGGEATVVRRNRDGIDDRRVGAGTYSSACSPSHVARASHTGQLALAAVEQLRQDGRMTACHVARRGHRGHNAAPGQLAQLG